MMNLGLLLWTSLKRFEGFWAYRSSLQVERLRYVLTNFELIRFFLSNREMKIQNCYSSRSFSTNATVIQDSILGSTLFLNFINDINS